MQTSKPISAGTVSNQAGGGGARTTTTAGLKITAPKRFIAGTRTNLLLAFVTRTAGTLKVELRMGSKVASSRGATFGAAGSYSMKLKVLKKLAAGSYTLRTFTPKGARTVIRTFKLKVVRTRSAHQATRYAFRVSQPLRGTPGGRLPTR